MTAGRSHFEPSIPSLGRRKEGQDRSDCNTRSLAVLFEMRILAASLKQDSSIHPSIHPCIYENLIDWSIDQYMLLTLERSRESGERRVTRKDVRSNEVERYLLRLLLLLLLEEETIDREKDPK
jgi:hypothetical protein